MSESLLVVDVGSGTQDCLVYQKGSTIENCPKFVVPSRTQIVAEQIRRATVSGQGIFLHGYLMGGGACGLALKKHLAAGLKAYATENAALTFNDNLNLVKEMGIIIIDETPQSVLPIWLGDIEAEAFRLALAAFSQEMPERFAVAVQDHGFTVTESNRTLRFRLWEEFIQKGGQLKTLVFDQEIPEVYTRMRAVRECLPGTIVSDTGTAALLGIMADPLIKPHLEQGILAINIGNSHTLAAAIRGERVYGIFEQHTGLLDVNSLKALVQRLQSAELTNEEIFNQGGHGAALHQDMENGWNFIAVTGPRRSLAKPLGWYEAAPFGDMMLTGCFGLLAGTGAI